MGTTNVSAQQMRESNLVRQIEQSTRAAPRQNYWGQCSEGFSVNGSSPRPQQEGKRQAWRQPAIRFLRRDLPPSAEHVGELGLDGCARRTAYTDYLCSRPEAGATNGVGEASALGVDRRYPGANQLLPHCVAVWIYNDQNAAAPRQREWCARSECPLKKYTFKETWSES